MKASDKMKLNGYVARGYIKRKGEQLVLDPEAFPSEEEYELLLQAMHPDYVLSITKAGVVAVPNVK